MKHFELNNKTLLFSIENKTLLLIITKEPKTKPNLKIPIYMSNNCRVTELVIFVSSSTKKEKLRKIKCKEGRNEQTYQKWEEVLKTNRISGVWMK